MKLNAKNREITGSKVKTLRKNDEIPAVLYGKGITSLNLTLDIKEFNKVYKEAGESTILDLRLDGKSEDKNVLIHHVDFDPVSDFIIHADLYQVNMKEEVTANVPLVFSGESVVVKTENGVLIKNIHEVEVSSLPKDLPHEIIVDLSLLEKFGDVISISDLKISENVNVKLGGDEAVVSVIPPRTQKEIEALSEEVAPVDVESVKVEAEEKKEDKEEETQE